MLKPQSIRKGVTITLNGKEATKQEVLDLSSLWTESQENFFRKMLKQGGQMKFNGILIQIIPQEKTVNSRGEKDGGKIIFPTYDMRF